MKIITLNVSIETLMENIKCEKSSSPHKLELPKQKNKARKMSS
jgi:hypothetical protein